MRTQQPVKGTSRTRRLATGAIVGAVLGALMWGGFCYVLFNHVYQHYWQHLVREHHMGLLLFLSAATVLAWSLAGMALAVKGDEPCTIAALRLLAAAVIGIPTGAAVGLAIRLTLPRLQSYRSLPDVHVAGLLFVYPEAGAILTADLAVILVSAIVYLRQRGEVARVK